MIAIDDGVPPPVELPVTVSVAEEETTPVNPLTLAVMVVVPAETPVAKPLALIVATPGAVEVHVTESVRSCVLEGWLPWPKTPSAVNCTVWPVATDWVVGDTETETANGLVQPAIGNAIAAMRRSTRDEKTRSFMVDLWSLQTALALITCRHGRLSLACMPLTIGHSNSTLQSHEGVTFDLASKQSIILPALALAVVERTKMVTRAASKSLDAHGSTVERILLRVRSVCFAAACRERLHFS
jgi:hypothetical protein